MSVALFLTLAFQLQQILLNGGTIPYSHADSSDLRKLRLTMSFYLGVAMLFGGFALYLRHVEHARYLCFILAVLTIRFEFQMRQYFKRPFEESEVSAFAVWGQVYPWLGWLGNLVLLVIFCFFVFSIFDFGTEHHPDPPLLPPPYPVFPPPSPV